MVRNQLESRTKSQLHIVTPGVLNTLLGLHDMAEIGVERGGLTR